MRLKYLALIALAGGVSACETAPPTRVSVSEPAVPAISNIRPGERSKFRVPDRVFFDLDSYVLKSEDIRAIARQANFLLRFGGEKVVIEGHTDERGTREYNLALGLRRAQAVKDQLIAFGVPADRLVVISYGKERPWVSGASEMSYSINRRAITDPCPMGLTENRPAAAPGADLGARQTTTSPCRRWD